ncbi:MAG: Pilus assembly protein PilO [Pyrinomonadaceae bacterium]|nr:Pilus assembly protein PilO [Pyrinomonadaceae bacterium]
MADRRPTTADGAEPKRSRRSIMPAQLRARFAPSQRRGGGARPTGTIRVPEIVALTAAALFLTLAASAYFFLLVPERARLAALETERAQLQAKLRASSEGVERNETTQASVDKIVTSLSEFETTALASRDPQTTTAVIGELNEKTRRHNLARAQFSFSHLDEAAAGQTAAQQAAARAQNASKRESVFPAIDISLTIEGPYGNLRRFIRDIEQSRRFIVINGIQLEGVSDTGDSARAALVSLRLDMSAHFRRSGATLSGGATAAPASTSQ